MSIGELETYELKTLAGNNILALAANPYPGRGIVAGLDESGRYMIQVYWIMGRSPNSRNRVFGADDNGRLFTEAADPSKVDDPSLIIYNAMLESGLYYVVSNGDQTDTVISALGPNVFSLDLALRGREYEPDKPNFTPRITAISSIAKGRIALFMSVLRRSPFREGCDRSTYELSPAPGFGYCIMTYAGDGFPLPPFLGDPVLMPLVGGIEEIANDYWAALNEENRVSLAVKSIQISSGHSSIHIINKYTQV
ncbi:MAG TPA: IMP cyclohydrolase [Rectinemataceae bacterium]|nr:IMP cyclohydrolase [Rectinemataceae bacterium]